jgi:hypothetical protein
VWKEGNLNLYLASTKINSSWIIDPNVILLDRKA